MGFEDCNLLLDSLFLPGQVRVCGIGRDSTRLRGSRGTGASAGQLLGYPASHGYPAKSFPAMQYPLRRKKKVWLACRKINGRDRPHTKPRLLHPRCIAIGAKNLLVLRVFHSSLHLDRPVCGVTMSGSRQYDVVVFGSTGYTGQFVNEELYRIQGEGKRQLKWAAAARSQSKLEAYLKGIETLDFTEVNMVGGGRPGQGGSHLSIPGC